MSWDLALDGDSGDIMFGASGDLLGVSGVPLVNQRILVRTKIPRGSWYADDTGTLGSDLYLISGAPSSSSLDVAKADVLEALVPMDDITVNDVDASITDDDRLLIVVSWTPASAVDSPADENPQGLPQTPQATEVTF